MGLSCLNYSLYIYILLSYFLTFLLSLILICYCNLFQEAETFAKEQNFGTNDLKEIALKICNLPKQNENRSRVCIITTGHNPVILAKDNQITEYPVASLTAEDLVDTNGAGDAFAGGFLAQYIQNKSLDVCIKCGIYTATKIIQRSGCTFEGKADFVV